MRLAFRSVLTVVLLSMAGVADAGPFEDGHKPLACTLERPVQDYAEAAKLFRKAADQGNAGGQYCLGLMYANGQGVPQDYAEAVALYLKAADQGDAVLKTNLATCTSLAKASRRTMPRR